MQQYFGNVSLRNTCMPFWPIVRESTERPQLHVHPGTEDTDYANISWLWLKAVATIGTPHWGGLASGSPLFSSLAVNATSHCQSSCLCISDSTPLRLSFERAIPSQKVKLPSLPAVQKVPCILWKVILFTAKTFWEPLCAGVPAIAEEGMSYRWHLKE